MVLLGRLVMLCDFAAAGLDLLPAGFGMEAGVPGLLAAFGLPVLDLAALGLLTFGLLALGLLALGLLAWGRAAFAVAAGRCLEVADALRPVLLAPDGVATAFDLPTLAGAAVDMVLAAVVSALDAALMAFVAVFMAVRAVDMVLADAVALVAADVIFVAAVLTLAAADDTVLAAVACASGRVRVDVARAAGRDRFAAAGFAVALDFGLVPARLTTALLRALVRAVFAAPRRAGLRAVVC